MLKNIHYVCSVLSIKYIFVSHFQKFSEYGIRRNKIKKFEFTVKIQKRNFNISVLAGTQVDGINSFLVHVSPLELISN